MDIELAEAETEYYYVRSLCEINSAQNGDDFWRMKKWLIEANPILVEDEKDRERLNCGLNSLKPGAIKMR